jgi:hypothetical protein
MISLPSMMYCAPTTQEGVVVVVVVGVVVVGVVVVGVVVVGVVVVGRQRTKTASTSTIPFAKADEMAT